MPRRGENLVWLDLETTGLNVERRVILEVATIITDKDLNTLEEGLSIVVHHPPEILSKLDSWCRSQHAASGLLAASRESTISVEEAEQETLTLLRKYCPPKLCPLCGNSICFDRRFLIRYMPKLDTYLSYRNVDVSSIKELVRRWLPGRVQVPEKQSAHRALDDIRESIDELRLYRRFAFMEENGKHRMG